MDQYALPQNGMGYRTARGCAAVWVPCPTLLVVSLHGHGEAALAAPIIAAFDTLSTTEPVHVFVDCESLSNYESTFRTALTGRLLPDRGRLATLRVLVKSRIVSMGATVMSLALGGILEATTEREPFVAALDSRLFDNRVVGFSSQALSLVRFDSLRAQA